MFFRLSATLKLDPAKRAKYSNFHITKTTQWILTKFCQMIKTSKYS